MPIKQFLLDGIKELGNTDGNMGIGAFVTPTNEKTITLDESSWKPKSEETFSPDNNAGPPNLTAGSSSKKTKVQNYFKKCKSVLSSRHSSSKTNSDHSSSTTDSDQNKSSPPDEKSDFELKTSEINEIEDIFYDALVEGDGQVKLEVASLVLVKGTGITENNQNDENQKLVLQAQVSVNDEKCSNESDTKNSTKVDVSGSSIRKQNPDYKALDNKKLKKSSPFLVNCQDKVEETNLNTDGFDAKTGGKDFARSLVKNDIELLVEKYFGHIYQNYDGSRKCLIRQARNLLVCEFRGCLKRFKEEFCIPGSKLLMHIKNEHSNNATTPSGWPLCLGQSGVVIQLGPLEVSSLRNHDCYLCLQTRSQPGLEVTLTWKRNNQLHFHTVAEFRNPPHSTNDIMCSSVRTVTDLEVGYVEDLESSALPELLQNLLVSVEHAMKRVPLDDLTFPCPQCHQYVPLERQEDDEVSCSCQCFCRLADDNNVLKKDSSIQTSPMFEFAGSIPHIDSDEDVEDKESVRTGTSNKKLEIARPRFISELPDKLLMSGINLPGTFDKEGRPIMLCYAECISRTALNKYEIAKLLQYYASIPMPETKRNGFTILLVADNEADCKILELLDKSVCLVQNNVRVSRFLIWTPGLNTSYEERALASQAKVIFISDGSTLFEKYLSKDQAPASCHGTCAHDQLEWVEFFKQLEPFLVECKTAGKSLLTTLSCLRNEEIPKQITRRFLNHQCRQISKALDLENVQKLKREGYKTLENLSERSQWLSGSEDVTRGVKCAYDSFYAVEQVTKRLKQLKFERMERLKELARFKSLQEEAEELLNWITKIGEETLNNLILILRATADSSSVKEVANNFDEFFFKAWKQIEKSNDLVEECKNIKDVKGQQLKEVALALSAHSRTFKEKLEDTRERIEEGSRCFLLLESCHDILEDDSKEQEEFFKLAERSGNDKLLQMCKETKKSSRIKHSQPPDKYFPQNESQFSANSEISASSTPYKSPSTQIRRRSVSSLAYIYHCSHHAAGEVCNCYDSDTENSVSFRLKKKYIQTLQNCPCQNVGKEILERKNSGFLGEIKELRESAENILEKMDSGDNCRRYDSGFSTAENSIVEESTNSLNFSKRNLHRTCSCQYYKEGCAVCSTASSSTESNQDTLEHQQDSVLEESIDEFHKSHNSDDIEDENYGEERRKVPSLSANNHLYCHSSTLDLPLDALYNNMDSKTQKTLTYIIREMIDTERDYVNSLDYVIINYIPELQREDIPQALRGHRNTVFGNIEKIYEFHRHNFLGELEECESNPLLIGQIFLKYDRQFYLYALYNKNKPKSDSLMSEYGTAFFKAKQLELKDKMDLASYLLKPVQRMGKYALLLQQMMKACPKSTSGSPERACQEMEDLKQAEEMVRFQLRHGNDLLAMDSIRECDVNLKEQGRLLRQNEFLVWEGKSGKKSLRQVFLFEELILFSKARRLPDRKNLDLYIYKNSIKMTDIGLTARISESSTKFEIWFRKRKPNDTFTLQSMSEDLKKAWIEELSQLLWRQAIRNRAIRMAEMSSMGIGNKPCLDIRPSIDQISDRSISFAQLNKTAPRFRNSIASSHTDSCSRNVKRPHSVISMSSVSSGSTSSAGSVASGSTPLSQKNSHLNFEGACESSSLYHRSVTLNSQCSVESGIIADMSVTSDELSERAQSTTS